MNIFVLVLRLLHVVGGIFWVGAALLMNFFIAPTIRATGDGGRQFAGHFMARTRFTMAMNVAVLSTAVAGFLLLGLDSDWFRSQWLHSGAGVGFTIGGLFGLAGLVTGFMNGGNVRKMAGLAAQIQGKPTPEQAAQMGAITKQQAWVVPVNTWTLLIAAILMAVSRYLAF